MDQDEDLGKSMADSFKANVGSTEGGHFASSDSFFDVTPSSMLDEQMVSAGFAADVDDMLEADNLNVRSADLMSHDLAIVPHASHSFGHGRDDGDAIDSDAVPLSFSVSQTVLTSRVTGVLYSVLIPLSCVDKEYTRVYSTCCVLISRKF